AAGLAASLLIASALAEEPQRGRDQLKEILGDEHALALNADLWIYNDIEAARAEARKQNKPLFVTFRCVPCKACRGFDAEVAQGSDAVRKLAQTEFVSVRQVEMKGVDLTQFQFDHDLNWAAMFIHPDGTVYARYGTQSAEGPDAYNSIEGLLNTMRRVVELHREYPRNKESLQHKRPPQKPYQTALEMPGLKNKDRYRAATARENCIHCHNIHDAENRHAQQTGTFTQDMLWRYPLPENVDLVIDPDDGVRIAEVKGGTPADEAGLQPGENILRIEGQPITSIADMQWVLHQLPNDRTTLEIESSRTGTHLLELSEGWKRTDISWRGSIWSLSPRLNVWAPELSAPERRERKLPADRSAFLVRWINRNEPGGRAAYESGLREGDVVLELDGEPLDEGMTASQFMTHVKLNYEVGDELPLTILRDDKKHSVRIKLVD
ncbi:MAG: Trx7/PDZ domain-containing (seleno)protein, partial [Planctomycetaceae bacterium]